MNKDYSRFVTPAQRKYTELTNPFNSREKHKNEPSIDLIKDFKFEIIKKHRDPLTRQVDEAVKVNSKDIL